MSTKSSKKKSKAQKTPTRFTSPSAASNSTTPSPQPVEDESLVLSLLESASSRYPSFLYKSAFVGRISDVSPGSIGPDATIWLSAEAMVKASLRHGSLVSVSLPASSSSLRSGCPLDSFANSVGKKFVIRSGDSVAGKVGSFFALAVLLPSSDVEKDGVRLSWSLSHTMGCPDVGRYVFVSQIPNHVDICPQLGNGFNTALGSLAFHKCKDLFLEVIRLDGLNPAPTIIAAETPNGLFSNGSISSPTTPSSSQLKHISSKSIELLNFNMSSNRTATEDKQMREYLEIACPLWFASRVLLEGNLLTLPMLGQPHTFLVKEAVKLLHENSDQDLSSENNKDLKIATNTDAAFIMQPNTKIHLLLSPMELVDEEENQASSLKLGGLSKELLELKEIIIEKVRYNSNYGGVLLHGPPGTGKTSLARLCAYESGLKLFCINGPEVISQDYGKSEQALHKIFDDAKQEASALVFIDELDAIAPARKDGGESLSHRMVATLLNLMDDIRNCNLLLIAATNQPNNVDSALRRHGRFDREIEIGIPSTEQRLDILLTLLGEMRHSLDDSEIQYLASATHGFVGADLASL